MGRAEVEIVLNLLRVKYIGVIQAKVQLVDKDLELGIHF